MPVIIKAPVRIIKTYINGAGSRRVESEGGWFISGSRVKRCCIPQVDILDYIESISVKCNLRRCLEYRMVRILALRSFVTQMSDEHIYEI